MKKMISEINSVFSQKTTINPKDVCICAFSGGQDSVLLFIILLHLKKQWNIRIQLLHFHHFWQQKNFFSTYQVWQLSFVFKSPIYINICEVFLNTEKKARQWRKQGLQRISYLETSNNILMGHTASDRIETAIWHLIRGTSPQGLVSLKWQTTLLVEAEFFTFPKFFSFVPIFISTNSVCRNENGNKTEKLTEISSLCEFVLKIQINKYQVSKRKAVYKNIKNKRTCFCYVSLKKNRDFISKNQFTVFRKYYVVSVSKNFIGSTNYVISKNLVFGIGKGKKDVFAKRKEMEKKQKTIYCFLMFNFVVSKKHILRPLLVLHRNDVTFFSKKYFLPVFDDPTNENIRWSRNRIRHQLFPLLRFFFNPNIEYLLNNFLEISIEEQKYMESILTKIIKNWLKKDQNYYDVKNQLELFPKALQRRLVQKIIHSYTTLQPTLLQIEHLRNNY